ncbi:MAG: orotate phosphoribosyltransferase [Cyclobacteriaceae bacterium]|nr:orotate phosphoribosyltransferase [Cyclobacteriaceae bacterium]
MAKEVASELLNVGAIKLQTENPFTWASGWKSPIYCDNRVTLSYPDLRTVIKNHLSEAIKKLCPEVQAIAGVATAGIPQGALVADVLDLPFIYVRSKPKGHGMQNLIEGRLIPGQKVVVIEDLISTGGSSIKAIDGLIEGGAQILRLMSIFNYGFPAAEENFSKAGLNVTFLSDYPTLVQQALNKNIISKNDIANLQGWRKDPANWNK